MSWYTKNSVIDNVKGEGAHWTTTYNPSDAVPVSGIYKCLACKKEVTSNKGDKFPPQNHHQHTTAQGKIQWKLNIRTNTDGE
ncbi:MAG: hypothetical protein PHH36_05315 [Sideroxydans sp.]|nr:hypothetical protein [Sideroxydans sp.]